MKKYFLILLFTFSIFFFPKHVSALSFQLYTSSYSLVGSCSSDRCDFTNPSMASRRIRIYDNFNSVQNQNSTYTVNFDIVSAYNDLTLTNCGFYLPDGSTLSGTNSNLRMGNGQYGSNRWLANFRFTNTRTWVSNNYQSVFTECEFNVDAPVYRVYVTSNFQSNNTSGGNNNDIIANNNQNTQSIINNQNNNTQTIINNQNNNTQDIIDAQGDTTDAINDLNDTLQETTLDDETIGDKVGDIERISDTPITDLLTMPLVLLNKLYSSLDSSCSSYTLGTLFNHTITLPCINGQQIFGSTVWTIIDGLFVIFMLYNIGMMVVHFFENVTSLNDTFDDMYVPQHAKGGGK